MDIDNNGHFHKHANFECGTPACAAGWATHIFKELYFDNRPDHKHIHLKRNKCDLISFNGWEEDLQHIIKFFDLTKEEATHLFRTDDPFRTPLQEAQVIERLVKNEGI